MKAGEINHSGPQGEKKYYKDYSSASIDVTDYSPGSRPVPVASHGAPLTPLAAGATLINLVLATGPFSYPDSYVKCSPVLGAFLMGIILVLAYMTAGFMVEALSISCAMRFDPDEDERTIYPLQPGETPEDKRKRDTPDADVKNSPYYIREKIEISKMSDDHMHPYVKYILFIIIGCYMYGAMIFKYVSGAQSISQGISFTFSGSRDKFNHDFHFYYVCIIIFAAISIVFSLGNIENSRLLQVITMYLRFFTTFLMIIGSLISIFKFGITMELDDIIPDMTHASNLFANSVFVFVAHHSIAGIVKPVRPQVSVYNILFYSFTVGSAILVVESALAALAFTNVNNPDCDKFPCDIQDLYNENFTAVPFIGQVCNFYPALNVAAVPILTITLRNNLFVMLGMDTKSETRFQKALWSFGLSIPVVIIACLFQDAQVIMTYTGGIGGTCILFIVP